MINFETALQNNLTPLIKRVLTTPAECIPCLSGGEQRIWRILQVLQEDVDGLDGAEQRALVNILGAVADSTEEAEAYVHNLMQKSP